MEKITAKITTSDRLKQILAERNMKQIDIIEAAKPFSKKFNIKLNKNDLSQYIHGKSVPGQRKLSILGMALNVNEAWLMGYDVPMEREGSESKEQEKGPETLTNTEQSYDYSSTEKSLIMRYRKLDTYGQEAVNALVDIELKRCTEQDETKLYPPEITEMNEMAKQPEMV